MTMCLRPEKPSDFRCSNGPSDARSCPSAEPPPAPAPSSKYFHEVGAEMIGNRLIIRMEKDRNRRKKRANWDPPCDCDVIEIKRPTSTKGPRIVNGGDNNQILFRIHSKTHLNKKEDPNYRPQAIAYKINRSGTDDPDHCRKITVYPQLGGPVSQEVYSDHATEGEHDVYLLRVKKKNDSPEEGHKRNFEVELRTPKPPVPPKPPSPPPKPIPPMQLPDLCKRGPDAPGDKAEKKPKKGKRGSKSGKAGKKGKK